MEPIGSPGEVPTSERMESEETEVQRLGEEVLSSAPTGWNKGLAASTAAWTATSAAGGVIRSVWSGIWGSSPPKIELSDEAQAYHNEKSKEGFQVIIDFVSDNLQPPKNIEERKVLPEDLETSIEDVNNFLRNNLKAASMLALLSEAKREELANEVKNIYGKIVENPEYAAEGMALIRSTLIDFLSDIDTETFKKEVDFYRGEWTPRSLTRDIEIKGHMVQEKARILNTSLSSDYLRAVGLEEEAKNIEELSGIRASETKEYPEIAGKTVNLWRQSVAVDGKEAGTVLRSGVFSVHSFKSSSIKKLDDYLNKILELEEGPEREALISNLKLPNGHTVDEALSRRLHIGVAQALPKLIASVQESLKDPHAFNNALDTGEFFHAEFSFLSFFKNESRMIHDMEKVIEHLNHHLKIQFDNTLSEEDQHLEIDGQDIVITLHAEKVPKKPLGVKTVMFNYGVNTGQAVSTLLEAAGLREYKEQTNVNDKGLEELKEYALKVYDEALDIHLKAFLHHFSKDPSQYGITREAADLEGVDVISDLIHALGGQVGIVCKSGKDRTGMAVSRFLSHKLSPFIGKKEEIKPEIDKGLSLEITGYNTGRRKGYAFKEPGYTALISWAGNFAPDYSLISEDAKT